MQENRILEALNVDIDVSCIVQWRVLWCPAPTSLNNDLSNDGLVLLNYHKAINLAIKGFFDFF